MKILTSTPVVIHSVLSPSPQIKPCIEFSCILPFLKMQMQTNMNRYTFNSLSFIIGSAFVLIT